MNCRNRKYCLFFLVASAAAMGLGCSREPRPANAPPETLTNVQITIAQKTMVPSWIEATGTVRSTQTAQLASQSMGNLIEVRVHEGDRVARGEVLAVIDDAQPHVAVDQSLAALTAAQKEVSAADSDLALAESTLKRYQQLYDKKSVSPQEFDEIKAHQQSAQARHEVATAAVAQAAAGVAQARKSLENTQIRAPLDGVVTEKKVDAGTLAVPGMPLLTVENTSSYRLDADVDESEIRSMHVGESALVTIDATSGKDLNGKVVEIVPSADPASRTFVVKVALPSAMALRTGMFGRARFARGERSAILVPRTALVNRGQLQGIYIVDSNDIVALRYITLGSAVNDQFEILSGLEAGEKLVAAPDGREYAGKKIVERP